MNIRREDLEILSVLVVSTSHLTAEEGTGGLEDHALRGIYTSVRHDHAFEIVLWDDPMPAYMQSTPPSEGLAGVIAVARAHGIERIRFDADGPVLDGLPIYNW